MAYGTLATAVNYNPDPPNLTPAWGSRDYVWLSIMTSLWGWLYFTSGSSGYTERKRGSSGWGYSWLWIGDKAVTASSQNPGAGTKTDTSVWGAQTMALSPPQARGGGWGVDL